MEGEVVALEDAVCVCVFEPAGVAHIELAQITDDLDEGGAVAGLEQRSACLLLGERGPVDALVLLDSGDDLEEISDAVEQLESHAICQDKPQKP